MRRRDGGADRRVLGHGVPGGHPIRVMHKFLRKIIRFYITFNRKQMERDG